MTEAQLLQCYPFVYRAQRVAVGVVQVVTCEVHCQYDFSREGYALIDGRIAYVFQHYPRRDGAFPGYEWTHGYWLDS